MPLLLKFLQCIFKEFLKMSDCFCLSSMQYQVTWFVFISKRCVWEWQIKKTKYTFICCNPKVEQVMNMYGCLILPSFALWLMYSVNKTGYTLSKKLKTRGYKLMICARMGGRGRDVSPPFLFLYEISIAHLKSAFSQPGRNEPLFECQAWAI